MSSNTSDYSLIQDEDVLKRMWQDTDDFGRKKEIRAHMYKIRETRLKDFYTNTGEESIKTTKTCSDKMTHADSLGDQSFLSLKTKEIRDSESPTRDAYKITGISKKHDQGWDIMETNRSSEDGKHHVSTRLATTSGKKEIQGGEAKYAAKAEQKASVSHEGDDKNYTKSVGNSTSNVIKQEAHGGDENSKFFTSSMTSSSSSQFKSEQKSTSGDLIDDFDQIRKIKENNPINDSNGKTKVYTETKTLPDGSTVTTTRYETVSGSKSYSTSSQKKSESQSHHQTTSSQSQRNESVSVPTQEIVIVKNQYFDDDDQSRRVVGKDLGSQNVKVIRSETKTSTQTKPVSTQEVVITSQKCFDDQKNVESFDDFNTEQSRRRIHDLKTLGRDDVNVKSSTIQKTTEKMITGDDKNVYKVVENFQPEQIIKTTNKIDQYKSTSDDFLQNERRDVVETAQKPLPVEIIPIETKKPLKPEQDFIPHERREPFNPPKSELDEKRSPTDGQYETTYRTDYVSKKISVDINPTHDAFVRSLRSVSPDRNRIPSGRNSRTPSQSSLRSSPEKIRRSPEKSKTRSPEKIISNKKNEKFSSTETFIKTKKSDYDSNTLTRKKKVSRSPSPTTTASEIEFVRSVNDQITDLDTLFKDTKISRRHTENVVVDKRPKTLDTTITTSKKKKVTERSPTSPLMDFSPKKSPTKEVSDDKRKPFRRTDTYEERCKEILGLINKERKDSITSTKVVDDQSRRRSFDKSPEKVIKKSPEKELKSKKEKINEFPSQIRKSPEKEVLGPYPQKSKEIKEPSKISEFPSQIKRSPEKESLEPYPEKRKDLKEPSKIAEFPSQIRKSPNKEPLEPYPEKTKESSEIEPSRISEFPSQVRKSPEKEPLEPYPEKRKESKQAPKVSEFPSQRRQDDNVTITSQETKVSRQDIYDVEPKMEPQRKVPNKKGETPQVCEFPSQIKKSPEKEPLEPYPEKRKEIKQAPKVSEFPSKRRQDDTVTITTQETKVSRQDTYDVEPKKETQKKVPTKKGESPQICEFPSQIKKSPEKEPLEPYPEKRKESKQAPKVSEFPSQRRQDDTVTTTTQETKVSRQDTYDVEPIKETQKKMPTKKGESPQICEFPSQIKKSPEKEPLEPYPEKRKEPKQAPKVSEFPSQRRQDDTVTTTTQETKVSRQDTYDVEPIKETQKKMPTKKGESPQICEFPSQIKKSPEKEPLEPYPEKRKEIKQAPKVSEFPSQRRQDDTVTITIKETNVSQDIYDVEPKKGPQKKVPNKKGISEFPSQIAKPIQKELKKDLEETLTVSEFLTETLENRDYVREKSPDRVSLDDLPLLSTDRASRRRTPDRRTPDRRTPDRRTPDRVSLSDLDVRKESELDSFIRNEQFDTEITLKEYEKKQKKVKKDKKIIKEDNGEVETSSSESDEEVERKNDIRETSMPIQMKEIVKMEKVKTTKKVEQKKPIQIKKIQKLETKKPIKETIVTKKNVQALCNDQRMSCNKEKLQFVRGIPDVPHKIVKKDQPEKTLYNKKPEITEKLTKTTKIEAAPKKRVTTTAKVTLTTPKIEVTPKKTTQKINQKIPSSSTKITRTVLQKTIEAVPSNRHVVSTIINLKPKTPTTIHKTTITKTVNSSLPSQPQKIKPKNTETSKMTSKTVPKVNQKKLPLTNGHHVPSDEEETDQEEEIYEKTKKKVAKQEKKCITTKSILIENAVADEREIIVDLKRSKSSREGTPDRICPYPVTIEEFSMPRYPDKITEPEDIKTLPGELKEIINEDVEGFQSKITEIQVESLLNKEKIDIEEDDCMLSVSDKVTKFITTAEELTKPKSSKIDKETKKDYNVDENDESLLSVSEKVSHFIATAEKVKKPEVKTEIKIKAERTPSPEKVIKARSPSPRKEEIIRECQLKREDSFKSTTKKETVRKESLEIETTPKTSRKSSSDEPKIVLSPTGRLRSTETIKKAKALFENINKEQEILVQRDILNRPSVFEGRKNAQPNQIKESKPTPKDFNDDDEEIPHYMTPLDRTIREHSKPKSIKPDDDDEKDNIDSQQEEIDEDIPHYMLPLDRSLRERSPHKENVKQLEDIMTRSTSSTHQVEEIDSRTTKFGVTLRRTDSGRVISTQKIERVNEKQDELNELKIEEIFDLKYLEKLLETIVGYDIRRRIRAQIRIVKKMIEEEKIKSHQNITKTDHLINRRRSTSIEKTKTISSSSFVEKSEQEYTTKKVSSTRRSKSPTEKLRKSPEKGDAKNETKKVFQTELKKTKPLQKIVVDEKPEWVTQKTLKKVSDNTPIKRTTIAIKKSISNRTEKSPSKEITDVITSSYGVGPLDENGTPLFGLKALRAQNKSDKVKVQGTVIQSQYYSENGQEPIGEVSVTKYSSDPKDLENKEFKTEKGISSITTTQKFGYKGTPSLKTIKNKGVEIEESSKTSKVTRRGSVKEISQKFIENAVETLKSERKSSFPKAGLILRSSSFKDTKSPSPKSGSSRETSPGYAQSTTKTIKTSGTRTETFLTDHSKVTGVQDVITRMKNEDIEGETIEDIEARNLLNKFIGSQVLLSGIESSQDGAKRTVTKITTSVSESGQAPKTITRTFTHPITPELLKTVWDQQTLNLLLEQSSDYEDRKIIRARLREIMAEQEGKLFIYSNLNLTRIKLKTKSKTLFKIK
nr:titin-like [Onthophagus taurus]